MDDLGQMIEEGFADEINETSLPFLRLKAGWRML